jgi:RNA polymerase sigma factor (sigma-70 family)
LQLPDDPDRAGNDGETHALMLRLEAEEAYQAVMATLTPREAEFWSLKQADYSHREIADILGVDIGTVGSTLNRAEQKVKKLASFAARLMKEVAE